MTCVLNLQVYACVLSHFAVLCSDSVVSNSLGPRGLQPTRLLCPWRFSRQEYWNGLPCLPPGALPDPGIEPMCLMSPALAGRFFTTSVTWEAPNLQVRVKMCLIPLMWVTVEMLFSWSNCEARLHEIHFRKWVSSWNSRLFSTPNCLALRDPLTATWAFDQSIWCAPKGLYPKIRFKDWVKGNYKQRRGINKGAPCHPNVEEIFITLGQIVGLQCNMVIFIFTASCSVHLLNLRIYPWKLIKHTHKNKNQNQNPLPRIQKLLQQLITLNTSEQNRF